jgi:nucleoside phosphorylase
MGLVEATSVASRSIEAFNPRFVAMSGICAGLSGRAAIGSLIVADPCWEHQAGKWAADGFKREQYDVDLDVDTRTLLEQLINENGKNWIELKAGLIEESIIFEKIEVAPMITGSAVIADSNKVIDLKEDHRKTAAIDMEMYGVYRSARISARKPVFFGAKTVVDLADEAKGDKYHGYGSALSARFIVKAIEHLHTKLPNT